MNSKKEHFEHTQCPVALSLDIFGDHWSLIVIRNLMFLDCREFKEMMASEEGISSNILSDRLKKLTDSGIISAITHPDNKRRKFYYLNTKGKDLMDMMLAMVKWADTHISRCEDMPEEVRYLLYNDIKTLKATTHKALHEWEEEHLGHLI